MKSPIGNSFSLDILDEKMRTVNDYPKGSIKACYAIANVFEYLSQQGHAMFDSKNVRVPEAMLTSALRMLDAITSKRNSTREYLVAFAVVVKNIRQIVKMIEADKPVVAITYAENIRKLKNALILYDTINHGSIVVLGKRCSARIIVK
jgi:hypothetical protein